MSYFLNGDIAEFEGADIHEAASRPDASSIKTKKTTLPLLTEKLEIPDHGDIVHRGRLHELLERSCSQFGGTLVSGRSGTGKTALVSEFASDRDKVAWYSVDPGDADWNVFARYFSAALGRKSAGRSVTGSTDRPALAEFLGDCLNTGKSRRKLIVLDNIHHLFDAPWFGDFFVLMLQSLDEKCHALMLCRSRPPAPLWRLRSKQVLNVIDERLLAFTPDETVQLCKTRDIPNAAARAFQAESFGRVSKLMQFMNTGRIQSEIH